MRCGDSHWGKTHFGRMEAMHGGTIAPFLSLLSSLFCIHPKDSDMWQVAHSRIRSHCHELCSLSPSASHLTVLPVCSPSLSISTKTRAFAGRTQRRTEATSLGVQAHPIATTPTTGNSRPPYSMSSRTTFGWKSSPQKSLL